MIMDWLSTIDRSLIANQHHWSRYESFIASRAHRVPIVGYVEKHHIWPRSLGGADSEDNLIRLTAREHFLAHWMLWKAIGDRNMTFAFWNMCTGASPSNSRKGRKGSRIYEKLRIEFSQMMGNKIDSLETRAKKSSSRIGKKHDEATKRKIGQSKIGKKRPWSVIDALIKSNTGREPWKSGRATDTLLDIWKESDTFYNSWILHGKPGVCKLCRILGLEHNMSRENIHNKFKKGWVPMEDKTWVCWKNS